MKITYTGRHVDFPPDQLTEIQKHFTKLSKLLDNGKGESEAHVRLSHERHLHNAEVTVNYHHHSLVGICSDPDALTAMCGAVAKIEKQAVKVREKWREGFRGPRAKDIETNGAASATPEPAEG